MESILANRFRIGKMVAAGSSAKIYEGTNIQTNEAVTIKLQSTNDTQLPHEAKVYKTLEGPGVPRLKWFGTQGDYNILVMDSLGPNLEELFKYCGKKLSLKSVLMLADQMIKRVEYLHSKSYLHRNIEPENFLMGVTDRVKDVYVIDFGVARKYRDGKTLQHIPYGENKNFTGSARFASMNAHLGIEQGRRDDLESLGYVFVYFLKGSLPWLELEASSKKQKHEALREMKVSTPIEAVCRGCPIEFASYFHYCRSLRFDDKPDYAYAKRIFRDLFIREGFKLDSVFDWSILAHQRSLLAAAPPRVVNPPGWNQMSPGPGRVAAPNGPSWSGPGSLWSNPSASSRRRLNSGAGPSEKSGWRSDKAYKNFRP